MITNIRILMEKLINKKLTILLLITPFFVFSENTNQFYTFKLENNSVSTKDSVVLIVENKMPVDSILCTEFILYDKDSSGVYYPYLENVELLEHPVPITHKSKYIKRTITIPPLTTERIPFFINQPYITNKIPAANNHGYKLTTSISDEVKLGVLLLGVRFRFSTDVIWRNSSIVMPITRHK